MSPASHRPPIHEDPEVEEAFYREAIRRLMEGEASSKEQVQQLKRDLCRRYPVDRVPSDADILDRCSRREREELLPVLRTTPTRSLSGVAVVAVQSSPEGCPHGTCTFCPGGPGWGTAQSYTGKEPAARRADRHGFDSLDQTRDRLEALHATGHPVDKVDVIVQGGTFPARSWSYQRAFVAGILDAMNGWDRRGHEGARGFDLGRGLEVAQMVNEHDARARCVGLTIETKPDWATPVEIARCLHLGATRLEVGMQTVHDDQLEATNRGHTMEETLRAVRWVKDAGLKLNLHVMPGLPGSTYERDLETFRRLFQDPELRPDMLKIYPTLVLPRTALWREMERGTFEPVDEGYCVELIAEAKRRFVPPWCRIQRVERDIPSTEIAGGVEKTNLRELVHERLEETGGRCRCIRCREAGHRRRRDGVEADPERVELTRRTYASAGGVEHFLAFEDREADVLVAFLRLREPSPGAHEVAEGFGVGYGRHLEGSAMVRELRTVDVEVPLTERDADAWQHRGYGSRLLEEAEDLARDGGFERVLVTAGIGVRAYYREKHGYARVGPYMGKGL